jgi:hypothetical protein
MADVMPVDAGDAGADADAASEVIPDMPPSEMFAAAAAAEAVPVKPRRRVSVPRAKASAKRSAEHRPPRPKKYTITFDSASGRILVGLDGGEVSLLRPEEDAGMYFLMNGISDPQVAIPDDPCGVFAVKWEPLDPVSQPLDAMGLLLCPSAHSLADAKEEARAFGGAFAPDTMCVAQIDPCVPGQFDFASFKFFPPDAQ